MKYPEILAPEAPVFARQKKSKNGNGASIYTDQHLPAGQGSRTTPVAEEGPELSTFNIIVLLIISALVITAYISNIIRVDTLMIEYTKLEGQESKLLQTRENLRADINTLTSYNRIQHIATEKLGLVHAQQQPFRLERTK